jgi:hypothetical protein
MIAIPICELALDRLDTGMTDSLEESSVVVNPLLFVEGKTVDWLSFHDVKSIIRTGLNRLDIVCYITQNLLHVSVVGQHGISLLESGAGETSEDDVSVHFCADVFERGRAHLKSLVK